MKSAAASRACRPCRCTAPSELLFGDGLVGGVLRSSQETGARVGELAVRVLGGTRPQDIPFEVARVSPVVDWRELQRWNIPASRLPAGTEIRFRELTIWERYRAYIVAAVAAFAAQAILIGALLVQRAQRNRADRGSPAQLRARARSRRAALERAGGRALENREGAA